MLKILLFINIKILFLQDFMDPLSLNFFLLITYRNSLNLMILTSNEISIEQSTYVCQYISSTEHEKYEMKKIFMNIC